jgi:uncharacterized protein (TIGR02246 family)
MNDDTPVRVLYRRLLDAWNDCSAHDFAMLFTESGNVVGFDGSQMKGRVEIESTLTGIFKDHATAAYVSIVREVNFLSLDVVLLRAVAGMVPRGKKELNPAVNAIQSMVARATDGEWRIALFQNTPAQFHGRPELAAELTEELRSQIK